MRDVHRESQEACGPLERRRFLDALIPVLDGTVLRFVGSDNVDVVDVSVSGDEANVLVHTSVNFPQKKLYVSAGCDYPRRVRPGRWWRHCSRWGRTGGARHAAVRRFR